MITYTVSPTMQNEWFLDASYAIALASKSDHYHAQARDLARRIRAERISLVTTRAVILEIGNALSKPHHRKAAVKLLDAMENDRRVGIVPIEETLARQGDELFHRYSDKSWGLTDCVSFIVMRQRGIQFALRADQHFTQAGFHALLG